MIYKERIEINSDIMRGKPVIKGTRITVELIVRDLSEGMTNEQILNEYPNLTKEDILASFEFSSNLISNEEFLFAS